MTRLFDILGAAALLVMLFPLFILIALCIVLDSPGAVFFQQERIGRALHPFFIYKFRTMLVSRDPHVFEFTPRRITRLGRLLRRWKLDELPQLFNVLLGEMSFVGPRPEIRKYVEMFRTEYEQLLTRRPGLTDPATLAYRDEARLLNTESDPETLYVTKILPDKLRLSTEYARKRNLVSDLGMILRTVVALFR